MTTPTTMHVMARDDLPAVFRPSEQVKLIPELRTSEQAMLAGITRNGSGVTSYGLAPAIADAMVRASSKQARQMDAARAHQVAVRHQMRRVAELGAIIDRARATNDPAQIAAAKMAQREIRDGLAGNRMAVRPGDPGKEPAPPWHQPMQYLRRAVRGTHNIPVGRQHRIPVTGSITPAGVSGDNIFETIKMPILVALAGVAILIATRKNKG